MSSNTSLTTKFEENWRQVEACEKSHATFHSIQQTYRVAQSLVKTRSVSVRVIRHVHDMVREHHHQPGPDIFKRSASREHGIGPQCTELPSGTWPIPPLHPKRPLDRHQYDLRRSHPHPSSKTAQRPDQGER